jgi:hypothetical protein
LKILYLSPVGKKVELTSRATVEGHTVVDLDPIRMEIFLHLQHSLTDATIEQASDVFAEPSDISPNSIARYDVVLCDLSTANGNVMFVAGMAEAVGKPVVYIVGSESSIPGILSERQLLTYSVQTRSPEFFAELNDLLRLAFENPSALLLPHGKKQAFKAFISYSHTDRQYLDRLMVHLKPMTKAGSIDVWVDTRIKAGDKWRDSIQEALGASRIAILMISADFLASDFVVENELPPLLAKAEVNGTRILPIILSPCRFSRDKNLNRFQSINAPNQPLSSMAHDEREFVYDKLAQDIESALATL